LAPSSGLTDAVITVAMGEIFGLPTTIRSMRTSRINAALVILADRTAARSIASLIPDMVKECGVIVVNVGKLTKQQMKGRYRTRWHLVYDYFRLNPYKFQRFTMTDAYDSYFQGDVFLSSVNKSALYFSTESISVEACLHNSGWIRAVFPAAFGQIAPHPMVCAGTVVGGVEPLLKFCELLFGLPEWTSTWAKPPDQAFVNYLVRTGKLEAAEIPYEVIPNDGFITTVGYCDRKQPLEKDANGNVGCPGFKTIPMLLHQYVRPRNMRGHMFTVGHAEDMSLAFKADPYSKASF
jgi:hypothetical protein